MRIDLSRSCRDESFDEMLKQVNSAIGERKVTVSGGFEHGKPTVEAERDDDSRVAVDDLVETMRRVQYDGASVSASDLASRAEQEALENALHYTKVPRIREVQRSDGSGTYLQAYRPDQGVGGEGRE